MGKLWILTLWIPIILMLPIYYIKPWLQHRQDKPHKRRSGLGIRTPLRDPKHFDAPLKMPASVSDLFQHRGRKEMHGANRTRTSALHKTDTKLYTNGVMEYTTMGEEWRIFGPRPRRSLQSVVLDEKVSERLVTDVKKFISRSQWSLEKGVHYRRCYLLYGHPRCSKRSFIEALASELEFSICFTSLRERTLTDYRLQYLLKNAPPKSFVVLTDIDAVVGNQDDPPYPKKASEGLTQVTFCGLMNAIRNAVSSEGRILFMTNNYVARLDASLIPPGSFDIKQFIGYCSVYQLKEMFRRFDDTGADEPTAEKFCVAVRRFNLVNVSPAQIQDHFLNHNDNYHSTFDSLDTLYKMEHAIIMYTAVGHEWQISGLPRQPRLLHSVVLDENVSERLVTDFKKFINDCQWRASQAWLTPLWSSRCGKTSFIVALASEFEYSICLISLSERTLTEDRLQYLLNIAPLKSIIVLEDIDAVVDNQDDPPHLKKASESLTRDTFRGLLNAIDGVASSEGRILFMTTNHVERLDAVRLGTVDIQQYVGYCSTYQLKEMFIRFYTNADEPTAEKFCTTVRRLNLVNVSPAQIQAHFLIHKENYQSAFDSLDDLVPKLQK